MSEIKYIGMDVHKEAISIAILNGSGKLVMESVYSDDVNQVFRRDVNRHSGDVNKVGAQRRWGCNHA
jgi:hypothetical protein